MSHEPNCPMSPTDVVDTYFLEHRAKVLDLAAFLDRLDRAGGGEDFRMDYLRRAIALLIDGEPERARRIQLLLSDSSSEPIDAAPMQGAHGAPRQDAAP
jgi:hypothetical protein